MHTYDLRPAPRLQSFATLCLGKTLLVLSLLLPTVGISQAAPVFAVTRGSYTITNTSNMDANDFHARVRDGRVNFKRGYTGQLPNGQHPFNEKVLTPANSPTFEFAKADNVVPIAAGTSMEFRYTALAFPGFVPPLDGSLDPTNTFLTRDGAALATRIRSVAVSRTLAGNTTRLSIANPGAEALVLDQVRVWQDIDLDIFNADDFQPTDSNSTLVYSASGLSLAAGGTFTFEQMILSNDSAPIAFEGMLASSSEPSIFTYQLVAFGFVDSAVVPIPGAAWLLASGVFLLGVKAGRSRTAHARPRRG